MTYKKVYHDVTKTREVEVPGEIIEVPKKFVVERPVIMPKYVDRKVPVVVAQSFWPILTEADETDDCCSIEVAVRVTHFVVQYKDYHIPAPIARPMVFSRLKVEHKEVQQSLITDEQYNALIKSLNPDLQTDDALDLFRFVQAERMQSLQTRGNACFQTELGVLPITSGLGTNKVDMKDDLQIEAGSDSRLQSAASTYNTPLALAPDVQTVPVVVPHTQLIPDVQTLPLVPTIPTAVLPIDYHSVHTGSAHSGKEMHSYNSLSVQSHHRTADSSYPPPNLKPSPLQPTGNNLAESGLSGSLIRVHHVQIESGSSIPLASHRKTDSDHTQSDHYNIAPVRSGSFKDSVHRSGSLVDSARGYPGNLSGSGSLLELAPNQSGSLIDSGRNHTNAGSVGMDSARNQTKSGSVGMDSARSQQGTGTLLLDSARHQSADSAQNHSLSTQQEGGSPLTGRGASNQDAGSLSSASTQQQDQQAQIGSGTRQWLSSAAHQAMFPDSESTSESFESSASPSFPVLLHRGPKLRELEVTPPQTKTRRPLEERLQELVDSVGGTGEKRGVMASTSPVWQVSRNKTKGNKHQPRYYAKRMAY